MKRFVNGDEADLIEDAAVVSAAGDRLTVTGPDGTHSAVAIRHESAILISYKGRQYRVDQRRPRVRAGAQADSGELRAPMPGQIVDVRKDLGDTVRKGDTILVLEAMKTQQAFLAPFDGKITLLSVVKGDQVTDGAILAVVEAADSGQ